MTSVGTYTYEIDLASMLGGMTRARGRQKGVQEFLSVDPLAGKNSHQSPYAFADNSPIVKVDFKGMDGILYLVVLDGVGQRVDTECLVVRANELLQELGINYQVKIFDHATPEDFNQDFLDANDNFIAFGKDPEQVADFLRSKGLGSSSLDQYAGNGKGYKPYQPRPIERAAFGSVALDEENILNHGVFLLGGEPEKVGAFIALHGAGHNLLGITHSPFEKNDVGLMTPGDEMLKVGPMQNLLDNPKNALIVRKLNSRRPGTNLSDINTAIFPIVAPPVDNYEKNRDANVGNE